MSQFNLLKGTQAEYNTKKDKIADGSLVMVKENNDSLTGSLYIKDGSNNIHVSTDDAVTGFIYTNGQAIASKANGKTAQVLQVDSALSAGSSNPVQNGAVAATVSGLNSGLNTVLNRTINVEKKATDLETKTSNLEKWKTDDVTPSLTSHRNAILTLWSNDTGKSVRKIANEELAAQLLSGAADADFETLQELASWLENHPEDAAAMNAAISQLDLTKAEARTISQSDYDNLSEAEKNNGTIYLIYDAHGFVGMEAQFTALQERVTVLENNKYDTASKVGYIDTATGFNTNNVQGAINALNTKVNSNYNNLNSKIDTALGNIETLLSQI